jgi:hypothetical protein
MDSPGDIEGWPVESPGRSLIRCIGQPGENFSADVLHRLLCVMETQAPAINRLTMLAEDGYGTEFRTDVPTLRRLAAAILPNQE